MVKLYVRLDVSLATASPASDQAEGLPYVLINGDCVDVVKRTETSRERRE